MRNLPSLVRSRFGAAQENGDLTFYATRVSIIQCCGILFQLRFSPALANKPKTSKDSKSKLIDPFENPSRGLFVTELPPSHNIVLNKFPVVPHHFILATKDYKPQTDLLEKADLEATYRCLAAYRENGEELFGFFNSGDHSGASQPHRHLQFLPVESMRRGIDDDMTWELLANKLRQHQNSKLPFLYFSSPLPKDPTPDQLHKIYTTLYDQAVHADQQFASRSESSIPSTSRQEETPMSYNLGITDTVMVLCPRRSEGLKIKSSGGDDVGFVALNGTILGGTLLVKNEDEWEALRNDNSLLKQILVAVGVPGNEFTNEEQS